LAKGAFGRWISRRLHEKDWNVVLVCRQQSQCSETIDWIKKSASPKGSTALLVGETCDLSSYASVKAFSSRYSASERPLHALILNAASSPTKRSESPEGIEIQFAVNVLSYFWLTQLLWPTLAATGKTGDPARVVAVASSYAGGLDLTDPEYKRRRYDNNAAYMASKQANRMVTNSFAEKMKEVKAGTVWVASCYPVSERRPSSDANFSNSTSTLFVEQAWAPSKLTGDLGTNGPQDPSAGAEAPVWAATDPNVAKPSTAGFWIGKKGSSTPDQYASDRTAMEKLWNICVETTERVKANGARGSEL